MAAYTNICRQCRNRFTAYRVTSRYCGATCRQQAHRDRNQKERIQLLLEQIADNPEEVVVEIWPNSKKRQTHVLHENEDGAKIAEVRKAG